MNNHDDDMTRKNKFRNLIAPSNQQQQQQSYAAGTVDHLQPPSSQGVQGYMLNNNNRQISSLLQNTTTNIADLQQPFFQDQIVGAAGTGVGIGFNVVDAPPAATATAPPLPPPGGTSLLLSQSTNMNMNSQSSSNHHIPATFLNPSLQSMLNNSAAFAKAQHQYQQHIAQSPPSVQVPTTQQQQQQQQQQAGTTNTQQLPQQQQQQQQQHLAALLSSAISIGEVVPSSQPTMTHQSLAQQPGALLTRLKQQQLASMINSSRAFNSFNEISLSSQSSLTNLSEEDTFVIGEQLQQHLNKAGGTKRKYSDIMNSTTDNNTNNKRDSAEPSSSGGVENNRISVASKAVPCRCRGMPGMIISFFFLRIIFPCVLCCFAAFSLAHVFGFSSLCLYLPTIL